MRWAGGLGGQEKRQIVVVSRGGYGVQGRRIYHLFSIYYITGSVLDTALK